MIEGHKIKQMRFYYLSPRSLDASFGFKDASRRDLENIGPLVNKLKKARDISSNFCDCSSFVMPEDSVLFQFSIEDLEESNSQEVIKNLFDIAGYPYTMESNKKGYDLVEKILLDNGKKLKKSLLWPLQLSRYVVNK